jgi:hypothetical protein
MKLQNHLLLAVLACAVSFAACKKMQQIPASTSTTATTSANDLVPTPVGLLPRSHAHFIERGNGLLRKNGHVYKVERESGKILEDFGEEGNSAGKSGRQFLPTTRRVPVGGAENTSWVTNAVWSNTSSENITSFTTNFTVPALPQVQTDGQTLFLFEGLQNDTLDDPMIIQPILQWGPNPYQTPGEGYWGIANWCVWDGNSQVAITDLINVSPGTNLGSSLTYEGYTSGEGYEYQSAFFNPSTGALFDNYFLITEGATPPNGQQINISIPQMQYAFETLEAYHTVSGVVEYGVAHAADYPAGQNYIQMDDIVIDYGSQVSTTGWVADNDKNAIFGESTTVTPPVNNSTNGGAAVFIYWHPAPTIDGASLARFTTTSTAYTINAYPGTLVNILLTGYARRPGLNGVYGTTTSTLTITTSGVTFTGGSTSVSATNSSITYTLTMPASGSVTLNGYYTSTVEDPPAWISALASVY